MKVWLHSAHASLEFYDVLMWSKVGIEVTGVLDWGSKQRPKIPGITDIESAPEKHIVDGDRHLSTKPQDMAGIDVYVLHETVDRVERSEHYAKMGLPVALVCFGQESEEADARLLPIVKKYPNLYLVPYSPQIVDRYVKLGVPTRQLFMIRFGVPIMEFQPWLGNLTAWFCAHNSIHLRGQGCHWTEYVEIKRLLGDGPGCLLAGNETDQIGGLGELTFDALKWLYRRCTIYLSMGTTPAPYTLTPVEAMAAGCPIVFYDNGCGIIKEEWAMFALSGGGLISPDTQQIAEFIGKVLDNTIDPEPLSEVSLATAVKYFDGNKNGKLWAEFFGLCK